MTQSGHWQSRKGSAADAAQSALHDALTVTQQVVKWVTKCLTIGLRRKLTFLQWVGSDRNETYRSGALP